jgi:hypothetical protein
MNMTRSLLEDIKTKQLQWYIDIIEIKIVLTKLFFI